MTEVALYDAKNRLSELIDRVLRGEVIAITRRGKVVARLAPPEDEATRQRSAQDAVDRLQAASRGVSLGGLSCRDLPRAGRRARPRGRRPPGRRAGRRPPSPPSSSRARPPQATAHCPRPSWWTRPSARPGSCPTRPRTTRAPRCSPPPPVQSGCPRCGCRRWPTCC
ncbi:MAG: type II toxin-antitoxin system prevent-host-death family antitoxin [Burkholderiaceae bacterium]|nr:type II toxin-antitoxin system prevent-host-death family antitoxin [Burkholderiaceae bacterium]